MTTVAMEPMEIGMVDADSHVAEPPDLWTARLPSKWVDSAPHVEWDEAGGDFRWKVGDVFLSAVGEYAVAGWPEPYPAHPHTWEETPLVCRDPLARARALDEWGIRAQVLYPNLVGFDIHAFLHSLGPEVAAACVSAYNDYLAEFSSAAPGRYIPVAALPVWDVAASVAEMERARRLGHKGILFAALLQRIGLPNIADDHWAPLLSAAQDLEMSINFHIGFNVRTQDASEKLHAKLTTNSLREYMNLRGFVRHTALGFSSSVEAGVDVVMKGVASRYPRLRFVSVESGFGYWPFVLEHLDWFWRSSGAHRLFPSEELPSEIWRRCYFATYWFERLTLKQLDDFADNVLFESDFPHETSVQAVGENPGQMAIENMRAAGVTESTVRKVMYDNGARLYGLT